METTRRWGRRFELIDDVCAASAVARNPRVLRIERAEAFKQRVEQSLRQWSGKVGYAAGLCYAVCGIKLSSGGISSTIQRCPDNNQAERSCAQP